MFNLFKKSEEKPDKNSEAINALIQRWDAFLSKIEDRYKTSIEQAKEALLEQMVESDYDYNATLRAWSAMRTEILKIRDQIDHTWDTKVKPEMEPLGDFHYDEGFKGHDLREKLYEDMALYEIEIEGALAEVYYAYAIQSIDKEFLCTQCHSPLSIKKDVFRMHYVDCQYCNTTNTYQPDAKYHQIGWFAIDALVAKECLEEFKVLHTLECKIANTRPPAPEELIQAHEKAYWVYHNKRLNTKIGYKSDEAQQREKAVKQLEEDRLDYLKRKA